MIQIDQYLIDCGATAVEFCRVNPITAWCGMYLFYRAAKKTKATWDDKLYSWVAGKLGFHPGVRKP